MGEYFCELRKGDWYYYITDDYFTAKEVESVEVEEDRVIVNGIILPKKTKSYCTNCETYTTDILLLSKIYSNYKRSKIEEIKTSDELNGKLGFKLVILS